MSLSVSPEVVDGVLQAYSGSGLNLCSGIDTIPLQVMRVSSLGAVLWLGLASVMPARAEAQSRSDRTASSPTAETIPALRSPNGRLQVVAVRSTDPVRIDGSLDDEVWLLAQPVSGFLQSEPHEGEPATEITEVRVAYDDDNLYIAAYCRDRDPEGIVVNNIRKDFLTGNQETYRNLLSTEESREVSRRPWKCGDRC